mmetsp:Transcript_49840/g.138443  ORF Transcript_49840/g.138443 Transcript_49840/m.138443 type:complete len:289 (+) Transcript_49840:836-1702(+)
MGFGGGRACRRACSRRSPHPLACAHVPAQRAGESVSAAPRVAESVRVAPCEVEPLRPQRNARHAARQSGHVLFAMPEDRHGGEWWHRAAVPGLLGERRVGVQLTAAGENELGDLPPRNHPECQKPTSLVAEFGPCHAGAGGAGVERASSCGRVSAGFAAPAFPIASGRHAVAGELPRAETSIRVSRPRGTVAGWEDAIRAEPFARWAQRGVRGGLRCQRLPRHPRLQVGCARHDHFRRGIRDAGGAAQEDVPSQRQLGQFGCVSDEHPLVHVVASWCAHDCDLEHLDV